MTSPVRLRLRSVLDSKEIRRAGELAYETTMVTESVTREIVPGMTEFDVVGELTGRFVRLGIDPLVILVGGDERSRSCPHPLPTSHTILHLASYLRK